MPEGWNFPNVIVVRRTACSLKNLSTPFEQIENSRILMIEQTAALL
jgi:hypothetical protein